MWNKLLYVIFIAVLIPVFEVLPQDTIPIEKAGMPADSLSALFKEFETSRNDSIIAAIPKDYSSAPTLRYFDGSLAEKYAADPDLDYERNIDKSFFYRLKEMISALLEKLFVNPDGSKTDRISKQILHIVPGIIFLSVVYIAVRLLMNHGGRRFFEKEDETVAIDFSNVEKHIHEADFETLIREAEQNEDTRQSVRLLYLWVLKTFTDRQIIQWEPDKTNIDYVSEIGDRALQEQFRYLSYLYNYIWYGELSINDLEYRNARETFFRHIKIRQGNE